MKYSETLAVMRVKTIDKLIEDLDELKEMNEHLREQNNELQWMLQKLNRKV